MAAKFKSFRKPKQTKKKDDERKRPERKGNLSKAKGTSEQSRKNSKQ